MIDLKVLAVDDEVGMRTGIVRALNNFEVNIPDVEDPIRFSVDTAETGEEALEKLKIQLPDIMLLDYKLPDITGLEVLEKIKDKGELLTIMITAYASLETAVSAIKTGAFDFLAKPFTPQELRNVITKATQNIILARQVKKLSEERKQVRFQFISVLGHELKAPLGSIEGYLYMMRDRVNGENIKNYENMIERCFVRIDQMKKLIYDLLELTKIESGQRVRELKEIDLVKIANNSIEIMKPEALRRNISLNLHNKEPFIVKADQVEMEIVLNNLISNAVKYNKDNGVVDVYFYEDDPYFVISVADTGIGLTKQEVEKLFREFVRIKNEKTKNILGSGLGLSTVKKIVELYDGNINVESAPDYGSRFIIKLKKQ